MRKNNFKKIIALSAASCMAIVGGAMLMGNTESTEFAMSGASIRYKESQSVSDNGIRFGVYANDAMFEKFSKDSDAVVGTLIMPTDLLTGALTLDTENAINVVTYGNKVVEQENVKVTAWSENKEGNMESIVYLTNIPKTSYNRALTSVGYIDWNGDGTSVEYTADSVNLSIADVALGTKALPETTETQKTELDSYINNYTVTVTNEYGVKSTQTVKYGDSFTAPQAPAQRKGYEFLGWAERTGESTYGAPGEITNLVVKSNREFVPKFNAVGPTYQKPAIQTNIYDANSYAEMVDGQFTALSEVGGMYFEGAEIEQGKDFMVYATLSKIESTPDGVGFIVGTRANNDKNHVLFNWRSAGDIYVSREGSFGWKGFETSPKCSETYGAATMTLIYKSGTYYMFINGNKYLSLKETTTFSWSSETIQGVIGTEGTKKVGLALLSAQPWVSDWGYSTDANVIAEYFKTTEKPGYGSWLYGGGNASAATGSLKLKGSYLLDGADFANGTDYVIEATMNNAGAAELGFVITTTEASAWNGSVQNTFLVYRKGNNDMYLWGKNLWYTVLNNANLFADRDTVTMTLVYTKDTYYLFFNGVRVLALSETKNVGDGKTMQSALGTTNNVKLGLVSLNAETTYSNWWYSTDAKQIEKYFPVVEKPGLEDKFGTTKTLNVSANSAQIFSDKAGSQFFTGVEIAQDQDFMIYVDINANFTADNIGFTVGTLKETKNHMLFYWRKNNICIMRETGGWAGHDDNIFTPGFGTESNAVSLALVYKSGTYYMFFNGQQVWSGGATFDNGWGGNVDLAGNIGKEGTKKIGLATYAGEIVCSDWGYSTDAGVMAKYVK